MPEFLTSGWFVAGGAAALTVAATGWGHLRNVYQQIASRVVLTVSLSGYEADAMLLYLKTHMKASKWGPRSYLGWMLYVKKERRVQLVPMEVTPPNGKLYWQGWRPMWTFRSKGAPEDVDSGTNARVWTEETINLVFARGSFDPDELIIAATQWFNEQVAENVETGGRRHSIKHIYGTAGTMMATVNSGEGQRAMRRQGPSSSTDIRGCMQYRPLIWSFSELGPEQDDPTAAFDQLALPEEALELVEEARRWHDSEEWYKERGVPWRRGWMLHGRPGTGKTALARAIAEQLDLPVYVYDLASLYNNELQQEWSRMLAEVPCMALIEDIDAVFDGRDNVSSGEARQSLTFDCLLNCLDGIERADGLFVVITTNRLERVDPALGVPDDHTGSSRPGRIDRVLELKELDETGRRKLASRILEEWPGEWEKLVDEGTGDTGAQFQERCSRRALDLHYTDQACAARDRDESPSPRASVGR